MPFKMIYTIKINMHILNRNISNLIKRKLRNTILQNIINNKQNAIHDIIISNNIV